TAISSKIPRSLRDEDRLLRAMIRGYLPLYSIQAAVPFANAHILTLHRPSHLLRLTNSGVWNPRFSLPFADHHHPKNLFNRTSQPLLTVLCYRMVLYPPRR
ncbi:MAG TPA: hypothetical protein VD994_21235, partial [Prosthecobacter sp.]|nr:hypothetical protein [Prosthecobacter sp.]